MRELATQIIERATLEGIRLAVAESLTGGQVSAALVDVPGASAVFRGGIVAYDSSIKSELLGVDSLMVQSFGAVNADVATQMAEGVLEKLGADLSVSTTGVAGPDPDPVDGQAPGVAFVAVAGLSVGTLVRELHLEGSRDEIRLACTKAALQGLWDALVMKA